MSRNLHIFNSLGRELQEFQSIVPGFAALYTCGLTVYNYAHIGNLRAYIFTDTLRRALQWKGYEVRHVMNITDVGHMTSDQDAGDDKMEVASTRMAKSPWEIAEFFTQEFRNDLEQLNIMPPSVWCKATDHILEMIEFARVLEERGCTYLLDDGLYFDTSKVKDYGRLALLDLQGQMAGARVEMTEGKRNPSDFAVWKRSPPGKQRLMEWMSPWGAGAPGWHLECSVMSLKYLGRRFDIHTGGVDHRQVHHCNEIAQNQGFLNSDFAGVNYWMHNEFLMLDEEKMSKSTGNFIRLQTLAEWGVHPLAYRYFTLMAHYRKQLQFSRASVTGAQNGLQRMLRTVAQIKQRAGDPEWLRLVRETKFTRGGSFRTVRQQLESEAAGAGEMIEALDAALSEDLNTPRALALLSTLLSDSALPPDQALRTIAVFDLALGLNLLMTKPEDLIVEDESAAAVDTEAVEALIAERTAARKNRNFKRADDIRDQLLGMGIALKDGAQGTSWEKAARSPETQDK